MSMFHCPHCGDTHHVNDFCATGPMALQQPPTPTQPDTGKVEAGGVEREDIADIIKALRSTLARPQTEFLRIDRTGAQRILDALTRPQPSGETREIDRTFAGDAVMDLAKQVELSGPHAGMIAIPLWVAKDILALIRPAPVASGGQHSSANDFPPGEVTDEWAERFCEAVNWSPDGQECKAVEGQVRCVSFRDLAKGYILSAIATQPAITSATAPVAETAGEAVEVVSGCARADLYTADLPTGTLLYAAPVPAQDDDKLRIAVEGIADDYQTSEDHHPDHVLIPKAKFDEIVAALKSTGAQEGGES